MTSVAEPEKLAPFYEIWRTAFSKVLGQSAGGAQVQVKDLPSEAVPAILDPAKAEPSVIRAKFTGGGALRGALLWSCEKSVAVQCAQLLMSEPVDATAEFSDLHADGYLEFLRQVAGDAAVRWKQRVGEPVDITYQAETVSSFETKSSLCLQLETDKVSSLIFRLDLDSALDSSLAAPPPAPQVSPTEDPAAGEDTALPANLDLILDVHLDATIRFGEREMLLQDVFGLMPGAVVELNQLVSEPAELLVAGRLVAKGEVVVVDGNFGLRVTEVVSRSQRAAVIDIP